MKINKIYTFTLIMIFSFLLRIQNINWDQGFHLHPDERAIVLFTLPLSFPNNLSNFFSPQSSWNPHFFAYGNFPLYLLKSAGEVASNISPDFRSYQSINILGRFISSVADMATLFLLFLLAKKLFNSSTGLIALAFYGISTLPIQLSHFYAVDTILTFFTILTLYLLVNFYETPTLKNALKVGVAFGFALATKISALVLLASVGAAICSDFFLLVLHKPMPRHWFPHLPKFLKKLIKDLFLIAASTAVTYAILEPYAFIDFNNFLSQNLQQNRMTHDAFTFPYTLQYVGKIPYIYELKNIFLFGLGPLESTIASIATIFVIFMFFKKIKKHENQKLFIPIVFFLTYFFVVGKFAIGFMRYMLPLYPLIALFCAHGISMFNKTVVNKENNQRFKIYYIFFALLLLIWPLSFLNIYSKPNTRVSASLWINENIPPGSTIAVEHWDDQLPLFGIQRYQMQTLELYNPDTPEKWTKINQQINASQYIVIASNRLYVPLQKLVNCSKLPSIYCYKQTANYYKELFDGTLGFKKVADFSVEPELKIGNLKLRIDDSSADESFTVYDHPEVMIFKKSNSYLNH